MSKNTQTTKFFGRTTISDFRTILLALLALNFCPPASFCETPSGEKDIQSVWPLKWSDDKSETEQFRKLWNATFERNDSIKMIDFVLAGKHRKLNSAQVHSIECDLISTARHLRASYSAYRSTLALVHYAELSRSPQELGTSTISSNSNGNGSQLETTDNSHFSVSDNDYKSEKKSLIELRQSLIYLAGANAVTELDHWIMSEEKSALVPRITMLPIDQPLFLLKEKLHMATAPGQENPVVESHLQ